MQSLTTEDLESIAPKQFRNLRVRRYRGDDFCSSLNEFAESDQDRIYSLYNTLCRLFEITKAVSGHPNIDADQCQQLRQFIGELDLNRFLQSIRQLGRESIRANASPMFSRTLHDIRGGGLTSLLGNLQLAAVVDLDAALVTTVFYLTRDHLKIMRNALVGLDDERRNADLELKLHSVRLLVEKWSKGQLFTSANQPVPVTLESHFDGYISECCVEFGALDRVLYNLLNNAARHNGGDTVSVVLLPQPSVQQAEDLRFVVLNQVTEADRSQLMEISKGSNDLRPLFAPGVTTTGSGLGLTIVADLVTNAYGLPNRLETLDGGYLGARLLGQTFAAWFHWPLSREI